MRDRHEAAAAAATAAAAASSAKQAPVALYPPNFLGFMGSQWNPPSGRMPAPVRGLNRFRARRAALSAAFPGDTLVIPTGGEKVRANDTHYRFRPGSDFYYLTGNQEPDCVLVLRPRPAGGHDAVLFVEPNLGTADDAFFTNRSRGALWVGPRLGVPESQVRFGVDDCRPLAELPALVQAAAPAHRRLLRDLAPGLDALAPEHQGQHAHLAALLSEHRLIKDSLELAALRVACEATRRGFEDVIASLPQSRGEREVEGIFNLRARVEGNDVGYNTIAAAGAHACVLHWTHNDGAVRPGELLLLDAGVEGTSLYTADITRTLPVSGTFSPAQRLIYELVLASQSAAIAEVQPGRDFLAPHRAAMGVLAQGLCDLKILRMPVDEALDPDNQFYRRYTLHGVSHMLGLDVHDCAQARQQIYRYGALQPGMVLTVEPGLYFQRDDLTVPARFRGIGVRIEDDLAVGRRGHSILSDVPRTAVEVERWMATVWRRRRARR